MSDDAVRIHNPVDPYLSVGRLRALLRQHTVCGWAEGQLRVIMEMLVDKSIEPSRGRCDAIGGDVRRVLEAIAKAGAGVLMAPAANPFAEGRTE